MSARSCTTACSSCTMAAGVLRTLASECASLADTGSVTLCALACRRPRPRRLGASAITVMCGCRATAWRTTSATSAICGSSFGGHEGADLDLAQASGHQRIDPAQLVRGGHGGGDGLQPVARADFADEDAKPCWARQATEVGVGRAQQRVSWPLISVSDAVFERGEQEPSLAVMSNCCASTSRVPVTPARGKSSGIVLRVAFFVGAFHVEFSSALRAQARHFAGAGQAQVVVALDVKVRHRVSPCGMGSQD